MIVHDFDILGSAIAPHKAKAPLVVDPNRVLAFAVCLQSLQAVSGRRSQFVQDGRRVKVQQLSPRDPAEIRESRHVLVGEEALRIRASKRTDHGANLFCFRE
jgi:hypothetical protein